MTSILASPRPPAVILERGPREQLRVEIGHHGHATFADMRVWYLRPDGKWYPSRAGVTIAPRLLDQVVDALVQIRDQFIFTAKSRS